MDIEQAKKINKSNLPETTKVFLLFVLSQVDLFKSKHAEKIALNKPKGSVEKIKEWHDSGSIFCEASILNGIEHGSFTMWNPKGAMICSINFDKGKLAGISSLFKSDGEERVKFNDGVPILLDK